ncbi:hypothetical protein [Methylobacterium pseudosasicola]|uniref:Homeodomain-like domain-containing protein n=1 Tax=Methylobacterium pseudosasicola TaxID=582667 RepID=A0A1I4GPJ3_9HYPH|nr:hypothetical protein [Methylobacterium pseudosasicola]SFL31413.1 hypothetical protein SAMN05192568_1003117 [Methylobacterium pseudosasicola]
MRTLEALPAERRAAVERLLRETALSVEEISTRTGVKPATILTWNARSGWLRPRRWRHGVAARWPEARRAALARLLGEARNDPEDVAEAAGVGREAAARLLALCGVARPEPAAEPEAAVEPGLLDPDAAADPPTLRAHLRAHIARQIAAFDAALNGEGAAVLDSARVLRDLGGLKRLLDEIGSGHGRESGEGGDGTEPDLPALRAEIARRYAGFVRGRTAA